MKNLLPFLILLIGLQSLAQKKEVQFGKITADEIQMNSYKKDTTAKAVVLFDKGESLFFDTENGYDIRFTRHKRIKVFDKKEKNAAEVSIPFYTSSSGKAEKVISIEAFTHNFQNGKLVSQRVKASTIYEEKFNVRWTHKKFMFPNVQDGAILDLKYVLETPFHFNLPDWTFQDKIPTIYSEYEVRMIPFYEYTFLVQGIDKFDYQNSRVSDKERKWGNVSKSYGRNIGSGIEFQDNVHTYVLKDIPAFKDESYISSINDYIIKMDFQLARFHHPRGGSNEIISTWPELNKALLKNENFGKYLKKAERSAKDILEEDLNLDGLDEHQKAIHIIEYVKNNFEWNNNFSKYASQSPKEFENNKKGNSGDINLFLISLLNAADIATEPVIISTRNNGKIRFDYPFDHFTNYVIALVKTSRPFLADASEELLPYNRLPPRCINEYGLIVNEEDEVQWINLGSNILSMEKNTIAMQLDTVSMDVNTHISIQSTEYESYSNRRKFRNDTVQIKEYYEDKIGMIQQSRTLGYDKKSYPYSINLQGNYETEKLGSHVVVKPFLNLPVSKNHLNQDKRTYPVDFVYPWNNEFLSTLQLPESYEIDEIPKSYNINNELVEIRLQYSFTDDLFVAKGNYKFKKAIYVASEYAEIKNYIDEIVEYFNQPVILKKS